MLISIIDVLISSNLLWYPKNSYLIVNGAAITTLRAFRFLRVFKLARYWLRFELLFETLGKTLVDTGAFSVILLLFVFTYTILGLEMFAGKGKFNSNGEIDLENGISPPLNFDDFLNSFFTSFVIVTNDS